MCITGASGVLYAKRLLEFLKETENFVDLVISQSAKDVIRHELDKLNEKDLANKIHDIDIFDELASGTTQFDAVVIIPCSSKTLASINHGVSDNLINRITDVAIKENRKVILCPRETPLSSIHLKNMYSLAKQGVAIIPLMPGFYHRPKAISDLIDFMVAKILDQLGINHSLIRRWDQLIKT